MNKLLILVIALIASQNLFADNWQKTKNKFDNNIVVIEYYEQRESTETMVEKSRLKKYLTGILLNKDGLIITSSDIFKANLESTSGSIFFRQTQIPQDIKVKVGEQEYIPASFIGKDNDKGIAFLRLSKKNTKNKFSFKKIESLNIGDNLLLINRLNNAYKNEFIINPRKVLAKIKTPVEYYICDPTIETLSDFGLVANEYGEAVGIYLRNSSQSSGGMFHFGNMSTKAPIEITLFKTIKSLIDNPPEYKEKNTERKKWLGVYMQPFTRSMAKYFGNPEIRGVFINTVIENSPAEKAGIKMKDVVTAIDGEAVFAEENNDLSSFREIIRNKKTDKVTFKIYRDSSEKFITVILKETPIGQFLAEESSDKGLGFSIKELTQDVILSQQLEMDTEGLWVSRVERGSWADIAGLRVGDLLMRINDHKTDDIKGIKSLFDEIKKEDGEYISMLINRRGQTQFLFIDMQKKLAE